MKSEYLMLAHTFNPEKDHVSGWFLSEKLDGTRAFWDGGISRGVPAEQVPYANTIKDGRFINDEIATGLWSRSGKVIHAPDWWLDGLPNIMLDGELWIGYGQFQELRSIVADHNNPDWHKVTFMVFDSPPVINFFQPREIKIRNDYSFFIKDGADCWAVERDATAACSSWNFELRNIFLKNVVGSFNNCEIVKQTRLPLNNAEALKEIDFQLYDINIHGGEGVMLRWGSSSWVPERSHNLLKHKPINTMDGVVIGYTAGEAGKTGQLLGKLGALIVRLESGKELKLSGLTHLQREIKELPYRSLAVNYPGSVLPAAYNHHLFSVGCTVEFKYRELSDDSVPKEARFWRIKE